MPGNQPIAAVRANNEFIAIACGANPEHYFFDPTLHGRAFSLEEPLLKCLQYSPRSIPDTHFRKNTGYVVLHRSFRNGERIRDFAIIVAARHQPKNLHLATAQGFRHLTTGKIALNAIEVV
jgi:hypothetical protein